MDIFKTEFGCGGGSVVVVQIMKERFWVQVLVFSNFFVGTCVVPYSTKMLALAPSKV